MDAFVISSLPPYVGDIANGRAPRSADITPLSSLLRTQPPPLVFGRLPGFAGYTAYPAPTISRRDEEASPVA